MAMTFEQVVETTKQFPPEQQEMLIELIRAWRTAARRREIARDAQESLAAFHSGQLEPQSAQVGCTAGVGGCAVGVEGYDWDGQTSRYSVVGQPEEQRSNR